MSEIINARIQMREDSEANWENINPVLLVGEIGYVSSGIHKGQMKIGDGITTWNNLKYSALDTQTIAADTIGADIGTGAITDTIAGFFQRIRKGLNWLKSTKQNLIPDLHEQVLVGGYGAGAAPTGRYISTEIPGEGYDDFIPTVDAVRSLIKVSIYELNFQSATGYSQINLHLIINSRTKIERFEEFISWYGNGEEEYGDDLLDWYLKDYIISCGAVGIENAISAGGEYSFYGQVFNITCIWVEDDELYINESMYGERHLFQENGVLSIRRIT